MTRRFREHLIVRADLHGAGWNRSDFNLETIFEIEFHFLPSPDPFNALSLRQSLPAVSYASVIYALLQMSSPIGYSMVSGIENSEVLPRSSVIVAVS